MAEGVRDRLASRIMDLESTTPPPPPPGNGRFVVVNDEEVQQLIEEAKNENTKKKTIGDVKMFREYLETNEDERRDLHLIPHADLDKYVSHFLMSIRKVDRMGNQTEYEPCTLEAKFNSISRHLRDMDYECDLKIGKEFHFSRSVLQSKTKKLKDSGKGNKVNKSNPLSDAEMRILFDQKQIGFGKFESLFSFC